MDNSKISNRLTRRQILKLGLYSIPVPAVLLPLRKLAPRQLDFYIAGVRFQKKQPEISLNTKIKVVPEFFEDRLCFAIYTLNTDLLGFVPETYISQLFNQKISSARIHTYSPHAVPWKRYRVSVTINQAVS